MICSVSSVVSFSGMFRVGFPGNVSSRGTWHWLSASSGGTASLKRIELLSLLRWVGFSLLGIIRGHKQKYMIVKFKPRHV
jgi:hypothetical protein